LTLATGVILALLPWWRNHDYVRDFYDYGLVVAGVGLIDQGQRPYVDFATPIQAGFFGLSWLVEKAGGGTYLALTRGGAALILVMAAALTGILARRWPWWAAGSVAFAVTAASASQHTILWHNALGVGCLAVVAWSGALAPVLRRADWPWHVLVAAGLFVGGINKLNFQIVALAAALAWAVRAGMQRQAGWGRVAGTGLAWLVAGGLLPILAELAWIGTTFGTWSQNVVGLAVESRAEAMKQIWTWKFLVAPLHDYYGPLRLPQAGLAGLGLSLAALAGCWPAGADARRAPWDRLLLPLAAALTGLAGAALLATNQEIAYVGLAAWLVLAAAVWLGFAPRPRRGIFVGGLVMPALVLAAVAWSSAWQGQRSQFGYSPSPRSAYATAGRAGPAFAYLQGVRLPPETVATLELLEPWLPGPGADGVRPVFFAAGHEWLNRLMPGWRRPGQPLWIHWGTTYGPRETLALMRALATDTRLRVVLTTLARDDWPREVRQVLERHFERDLLGPVTTRWTRRPLAGGQVSDSIDFINQCGGNVAGSVLFMDERPVARLEFEPDRMMLGVMEDEGWLTLATPSHRFGGEAVIVRSTLAGAGPLHADFKVIVHGAAPEDVRWSARVELPAGRPRIAVPFQIDSLGRNLQLRITVPHEARGRLAAGYRNLQITHAVESPAGAPRLRGDGPADEAMAAEAAESLLGAVRWRPGQLVVRGGRPAAGGLELAAGGEVWLHTDGMTGELRGRVDCPDPAGGRPMVRVVWYKGGRLQITQQGLVPAEGAFEFRVWCAEPGGWFGILTDQGAGIARARVQVTGARLEP
jgi:hypothetical protein